MGGEDFDRVAANAEGAALKIHFAALVLLCHEVGEQLPLIQPVADAHLKSHCRIGLDRTDTVDAGDRGNNDDVVALEQRTRRRVAHPVDLLVDRGFLLDIGIGSWNVGLRLIIVVVGDEIFDRIIREEVLELGIELGCERLVRRKDDCRPLRGFDDLCHRERLTRTGDAEQYLIALTRSEAADQVCDRGGLVSGGLVIRLHPDGDATFRLVGPGWAVRRPELAVLEKRIATFDQLRKRLHGGRDAGARGKLVRILQRHIEAGHRIEPGSRARFRIGRSAHRCAAGGFRRGDLHLLPMPAGLGGNFAPAFESARFRLRLELLHPVGDVAGERRAGKRRLRCFFETVGCGGFLRCVFW